MDSAKSTQYTTPPPLTLLGYSLCVVCCACWMCGASPQVVYGVCAKEEYRASVGGWYATKGERRKIEWMRL